MSLLTRDLSTGDVMIFDRETRDLYLIQKKHAREWHEAKDKSSAFAKELTARGIAKLYDKNLLNSLQHALAEVILLGAGPGGL